MSSAAQRRRGPEPGSGPLRVLVVDDEPDVLRGLGLLLASDEAEVREAASGERALEILAAWAPHVLLTDVVLGQVSGMELLGWTREHRPATRVLMITGFGSVRLAVEALRCGAARFITKPFDNQEILAEVERHGEEARREEGRLRWKVAGGDGRSPIVAEDPRMAAVVDLLLRAAPTEVPILIRGEGGTGKELLARLLHQNSLHPSLPFLAVDPEALPAEQLEAELFGSPAGMAGEPGASREGVFARACGGTVYLKEVAGMPPPCQGRLLRTLEQQAAGSSGPGRSGPMAFRLVTATTGDLPRQVAAGGFREDLYYRLWVVTLDVPPLRQRPDDIVPLARHFLDAFSDQDGVPPERRPELTPAALAALRRHRWPGNVRELKDGIRQALTRSRGGAIHSRHLDLRAPASA